MENLTIHQRINFKSHFPPVGFDRIKRVDHYRHHAEREGNAKTFDIPYWQELQKGFSWLSPFRNKF